VGKYTFNYMYNFTGFFLLYNMCSKYDDGKKYLKSNSLDGLVGRFPTYFLQNELAM